MATPMRKENFFHIFCINSGLFHGKDLISELGFVRYFHYHPYNVYLHLIGFHFLVFMILVLLDGISLWIELKSGIEIDIMRIFCVIYGIIILLMDNFGMVGIFCGLIWYVLVAAVSYLKQSISFEYLILLSLVSGSIGGTFQLFGHIYFDKSQPAFRFFEAFVTTPYYLYLTVFFLLGFRNDFKEQIVSSTMKWKGSERVLYGKRDFSR